MGHKSKKKNGTGSATKSKNKDEIVPIVALPAANVGESPSSAAVKVTGEATVGKNGDSGPTAELTKSGALTAIANSEGNLKDLETDKSKLVKEAAGNEASKNSEMATNAGSDNRNADLAVPVPISSNPNVLKAAKILSGTNNDNLTSNEASLVGKVTNLEREALKGDKLGGGLISGGFAKLKKMVD